MKFEIELVDGLRVRDGSTLKDVRAVTLLRVGCPFCNSWSAEVKTLPFDISLLDLSPRKLTNIGWQLLFRTGDHSRALGVAVGQLSEHLVTKHNRSLLEISQESALEAYVYHQHRRMGDAALVREREEQRREQRKLEVSQMKRIPKRVLKLLVGGGIDTWVSLSVFLLPGLGCQKIKGIGPKTMEMLREIIDDNER